MPAPLDDLTADRALVAQCCAGAPGAWEAFVAHAGPVVVAAVRRTLSAAGPAPSADIEDAAAEVMAALVADGAALLRSWRGEARLSTWLHVIARRTAQAYRARAARRAMAPAEAGAGAADPREGPAETAARRDAAAAVARALASLAPRDREVLRLYYDAGRSGAEIGSALGIPTEQVSVVLFRARERAALALRRFPGLR